MLVYYDADLDKRKFEGRTSLANSLKAFLEKNGISFTDKIEEADMIHVHTSGVFPAYKAYKLKKKYGIPCLYSLYSTCMTEPIRHIQNYFVQRKNFEKTATNWLLSYSAVLPLKLRGLFLKKLDKVIVPLDFIKSRLFKNTEVIRFCIDTERFKPIVKDSDSSDSGDGKFKVAFCGHPGVFKGINDFVKASKRFSDNIQPYMFITNKTKKIEDYVNKVNSKVRVYGVVDDIVQVYNDMDVIVLPYRTSLGTVANPLVLLEAMACGKPVITTNLPSIMEITKGATINVKPYSPNMIAKAVNKLVTQEDVMKEMARKSRQVVLNGYRRDQMFESYLRIYNELNKV